MRLAIGNGYLFPINGVRIGWDTEELRNDGDQLLSVVQRMRVEGEFLSNLGTAAANQLELVQQEVALARALLGGGYDIVLYRDDGGETGLQLRQAQSINGVRIVSGPNFPVTSGPEYATRRTFAFVAEAEYPVSTGLLLTSFFEEVETGGGNPQVVMRPAVNGFMQRQILYPRTPFTARQSGQAEGYGDWPAPPSPLWPEDLAEAPLIRRRSPRRRGRGYERYPISWEYRFLAANPFIGIPNRWL